MITPTAGASEPDTPNVQSVSVIAKKQGYFLSE